MQNDMLNTRLHILINGPTVGSKPFEDLIDSSVSSWSARAPQFVNTDAPPLAGSGPAIENAPVVIVQDAGVQTSDDDGN